LFRTVGIGKTCFVRAHLSRILSSRPGNLRGIGLGVFATFTFAIETAVVRHLSQELHPFEIAFFTAVSQSIVLLPWILRRRLAALRTKKLHLQTLRIVFSTIAVLALFYALREAPLAKVTALSFTMPIFTALLAVRILGEAVRLSQWAAILFGFAGAMVVLRPGFAVVDAGSLTVILSALFFALTVLVIKVLTRTDSAVTITIYGAVLRVPFSLLPALFFWTSPSLEHLAWFAAIGVLEAAATFSFTQALKDTDTSVIMSLTYLQLIWAAAFGYVFFAEVPGPFTWIGAAMIVGATTYIAVRESGDAGSN
jgi:drug/metabolite transporter (DMT)-like permease